MKSSVVSRRHFVKSFVLGTAFSTVLGRPWRASVLGAIQTANVGLLQVRLSDYPALLTEFGSVRLGLNPIDNPSGPLGFFYPIIINHETGATYYALDSGCRHAGCVVAPYDEGEGVMRCPCHGSGYAIDGSVVDGPTTSPLFSLHHTFDGLDTLTIEVPWLGYRVTAATVQNADAPRLQLDFPSFENIEYEVRFQQRMRAAETVVPFALSLDAPADQLSVVADGSPVTIFVDRTNPTGFYSVAVKVIDLTEP